MRCRRTHALEHTTCQIALPNSICSQQIAIDTWQRLLCTSAGIRWQTRQEKRVRGKKGRRCGGTLCFDSTRMGWKLPLVAFSHFTDETKMTSDGSCQHRNGIVIRSELLLLLLTLSAETSLSTISTQMRFVNVWWYVEDEIELFSLLLRRRRKKPGTVYRFLSFSLLSFTFVPSATLCVRASYCTLLYSSSSRCI